MMDKTYPCRKKPLFHSDFFMKHPYDILYTYADMKLLGRADIPTSMDGYYS
jgi:hypothetical protein